MVYYANEMLIMGTGQLLDRSWRYLVVFMQMRFKLGLQTGSLEGLQGSLGGNGWVHMQMRCL